MRTKKRLKSHRFTLENTFGARLVLTCIEYQPCQWAESIASGYRWFAVTYPKPGMMLDERHSWRGRTLADCRMHHKQIHQERCAVAYFESEAERSQKLVEEIKK